VQNATVFSSSYRAMKGICSIMYITNPQKQSERMGVNRKKLTVLSSMYVCMYVYIYLYMMNTLS
jgi:hypothetical protein